MFCTSLSLLVWMFLILFLQFLCEACSSKSSCVQSRRTLAPIGFSWHSGGRFQCAVLASPRGDGARLQ